MPTRPTKKKTKKTTEEAASSAHVDMKCGCVYCPFGHYFLWECARHTAERKRGFARDRK